MKPRRNQSLRLRAGESTAGVGMDAINAENMREHFDLLRSVFDEFDFASTDNTDSSIGNKRCPLC